ncbi:MAG: redoxin domain-containing protein [Planctomycetota bacterium]
MLTRSKKSGLIRTLAAGAAVLGAAFAAGFGSLAEREAPVVGEAAPNFTLTDINGESHNLADYQGKVVVLEWFNPDCPFVKKFHYATKVMHETHADVASSGEVVFLAINSGAPGKQGAGLERNQQAATEFKIEYPILLDESGEVGRMFGAKRTPEIFVIDREGVIQYHGPIDSDPSARKVGENYLKLAVTQVVNGESSVIKSDNAIYGCSVKYAR